MGSGYQHGGLAWVDSSIVTIVTVYPNDMRRMRGHGDFLEGDFEMTILDQYKVIQFIM